MTAPIDSLVGMIDMLTAKGTPCDFGVPESQVASLMQLAEGRHPHKAIRVVKSWTWWDLQVSPVARARFSANGLQPALLYSTHLLWDSRDQWAKGWNIKTTALVAFEENCFFITRNSVYILVGPGY